jgi:glucuronate isomerase
MVSKSVSLHPDRFFDPEPEVRKIARSLFESVEGLPLVCPHGHISPEFLALDLPFEEPTAMLLKPDHYVFRMLHSQGVGLEDLGIPSRDGTAVEKNPRKVWQRFADHYHLFRGTPSRAWLDYVFYEVFGIHDKLTPGSAAEIYDEINDHLGRPEFRPRALFGRFNIEVLTTSDGPADSLEHHELIRASDWAGMVIPCFRPDLLFQIARSGWKMSLRRLESATGTDISSFPDFLDALRDRRLLFKSMGATSTDHGVDSPYTRLLSYADAERLFVRALREEADADDERQFEAHMLMEMARMSLDDGLVMQIHPGSFRDHNRDVHARFGQNVGADIPVAVEYTRNLHELLNTYGNDPRLTLVVFTLDESTYSRELAPIAGHYPALKIGPPWWFFDSIEGMRRYRESVTETAGIFNTVGFNDDARVFVSIPARHDLSRRMDANWVARLVARHEVDIGEGREMMKELAYNLAKTTYRLH